MRRTLSVRHEHLFTAEWHPGGCKKRCVKEKTQKPTDPPLQPEAQEIVVMAVSAKAERARAPERAAQKHISTCGHQKKHRTTGGYQKKEPVTKHSGVDKLTCQSTGEAEKKQ